MTNPLANNPDAPNLGKLDPNNYTPDEFWKAFYMDMEILQPGAGEWTQQMLTMFWQNKDKINAACEAALKRIESDPKLRDMKGAESLEVGFNIVREEYEKLYGEKPQSTQAIVAASKEAAEQKGAIISINGHVSSFSNENFIQAFTSKYIRKLPPKNTDREKKKKIFNENGQLDTLAQPTNELLELVELHTSFFMAILAVVIKTVDDGSHTIKIWLPGFGNELRIDGRNYSNKRPLKNRENEQSLTRREARKNLFISIALPFEDYVGETPDGNWHRVLTWQDYDKESDTITLTAPYFFKLKEMAEREKPHYANYNELFHGSIFNEPNKAAVELANRILIGVLGRGETPDVATGKKEKKENENQISLFDDEKLAAAGVDNKKITYRIKYSKLIADCPQLDHALKTILSSDSKTKWQAYNSKLKQTFEQAYNIIMEKSDAPFVYDRFKLPGKYKIVSGKRVYIFDVPTKSTLDKKLIVTHYGKKHAS